MNRTATCHTEGCGNEGIPIDLGEWDTEAWGEPGPVFCGACNTEITDVDNGSEPAPEPEPEPKA